MLTGVVPFNADTPLAIALKQVSEAPAPPREIVSTVPAELEKVVLHALQKNPASRPGNADDLRPALRATAEELVFEQADSRHSQVSMICAATTEVLGTLVIDRDAPRQEPRAKTRRRGGIIDGWDAASRKRPA